MGVNSFKGYVMHQKLAKSECPTPKSQEMEHRLMQQHQQQKFFSRKSSGMNQAQVQNIQMTGLPGAAPVNNL